MGVFRLTGYWIYEALDHPKKQQMCIEAVEKNPHCLLCVPDHLKTQGMCNKAVRREPTLLWCVPDHFQTQDMRKRHCTSIHRCWSMFLIGW